MKQSIKAYLPKLNNAVRFKDFVNPGFHLPSSGFLKFLCSCDADKDALLKNVYTISSDALILIGPEGDFSEEEVQLASKNGFKITSLGESRLRTETAGMVACHTIQIMNE